jgi:tetratricopeptide (TPR) repeat protein
MASLQKGDLLTAHRIVKSALNKYEGYLSNHRKSAFLNLLGIIAVHQRDFQQAVYYYDASYQVDPTQIDKKYAALNNIAGIYILAENLNRRRFIYITPYKQNRSIRRMIWRLPGPISAMSIWVRRISTGHSSSLAMRWSEVLPLRISI